MAPQTEKKIDERQVNEIMNSLEHGVKELAFLGVTHEQIKSMLNELLEEEVI